MEREKVTVQFACSRCGDRGFAVWERSSTRDSTGRRMSLVNLSEGFYERLRANPREGTEIVCHSCGKVQSPAIVRP